jgi:hypothetical protein
LWDGVDLDWADEFADRAEQLLGYLADRTVGRERDVVRSTVVVLSQCFVATQVQRDDQRPGPIRGWQRQRLPSAGAEAQRRVLKLRFGWG